MKSLASRLAVAHTLGFLLLATAALDAEEPNRPYGLDRRVAWSTSTLTGSPDPPPPFVTEAILPGLRFSSPVILTHAPGTHRLFVVELKGKILSFDPRSKPRAADVAVDLAGSVTGLTQVYGLAFHPRFATNRHCYICYVTKAGEPNGTIVSRFTVSRSTPPTIDPDSEQPVIRWVAGGHNGGCLEFGPDGFLYISAGDAAGAFPPDSLRNGQNLPRCPQVS